MEGFGGVYEIYRADTEEYGYFSQRVKRYAEALSNKDITEAVIISDYCERVGIEILTIEDVRYPDLLKQIEDPPIVLYVRGKMPEFDSTLHVACVGTRSMTEYGKCVAYDFGYTLAKNGAVVVSGMALGCDSVSMCAALDAGGMCIGVLGCGVDIAYPPEHSRFMNQLAKHGSIISEYPPGTRAEPSHFPRRNRIISGISRVMLVVEGDMGSGAMISAKHAEDQGRTVYAVPGKLGEHASEGTVSLISNGAKVAVSALDILKEYAFLYRGRIDLKSYPQKQPQQIDVLLSARGIKTAKLKTDRKKPGATSEKRRIGTEPGAELTSIGSFMNLKKEKSKKDKTDNASAGSSLPSELLPLYEKLPKGEMFAADDVAEYGIGASEFLSGITMLEIYGVAKSYPGGRYLVE